MRSSALHTVVVSWIADNRRSRSLAEALGARAVFMPWAAPRGRLGTTALGWARSTFATIRLLRGLPRGSAVIAMAPPVFAPLCLVPFRRRLRIALDIHSGALNSRRWAWSAPVLLWAVRRMHVVVLTNDELLDGLDAGDTPRIIILNPSLAGAAPSVPAIPFTGGPGRPIVLFPASGEEDEPLDEVLAAAELLGDGVRVVATGALPERLRHGALETPGYLDTAAFDALLQSASAILALTTREATNQRSAAEAVDLGKPLICSDTAMLRHAYGSAAVMVANDASSIADGVRSALSDLDGCRRRIASLRSHMVVDTHDAVGRLAQLLAGPPGPGDGPFPRG
jgi:hypothetical protein